MADILVGAAEAFWLGLLTSISPCPMATNITAISFVGRRVGSTKRVLFSGFLYTAGRIAAYTALSMLLVNGLLSAPGLSQILQKHMNKALGFILIIVGMILLELIRFRIPGGGLSDKMQKRLETLGVGGALPLGALFALSFCPVSAALFFGSLIPLAVSSKSGVLLPSTYGAATGLPVLFFAMLIALGAKGVGAAYNKIVPFERWARRITGTAFILAGIYYCLVHIFRVRL
jgi:threonine/homoserine/homoserine lactone efflux protein